jgi:hypothetical protein
VTQVSLPLLLLLLPLVVVLVSPAQLALGLLLQHGASWLQGLLLLLLAVDWSPLEWWQHQQ